MSVYLDLDTGEVIYITPDVREELEAIYAELLEEQTDEEAYKTAFVSAIGRRNPPPSMHDLLKEADAAESGLGTRLLDLPQRDSHEATWICRRSSRPSHTTTRGAALGCNSGARE